MDSTKFDYIFKILIIGDCGVGKTALISRFHDRSYTDFYSSTIGIDYRVKTIQVYNQIIKIQIWDTSGNERFQVITSLYYKSADGFIVMYDVNDSSSFINASKWIQKIHKYIILPKHISHSDFNKHIILVGNKIDYPSYSKITSSEGQEVAKQFGVHFIETSIKQNINVKEVFNILCQNIVHSHPIQMEMDDSHSQTNLLKNQPIIRKKYSFQCC